MVTVQETLAVAEQLLPGRPAPDGTEDALVADREHKFVGRTPIRQTSEPRKAGRSFFGPGLVRDVDIDSRANSQD